jgi:hypothetical protein
VATSFDAFDVELVEFYSTISHNFQKFMDLSSLTWSTQTHPTFIGQFEEQQMRKFPSNSFSIELQCHLLLSKAHANLVSMLVFHCFKGKIVIGGLKMRKNGWVD